MTGSNFFIWLPKVKRCCLCTRNLKIATIIIIVCTLLINIHVYRILFMPVCVDIHSGGGGILKLIKWILFAINILSLVSGFTFLLSIFVWPRPIIAEVYMGFGFLSAAFMLALAVLMALKMTQGSCGNPSDIISFIVYCVVWMYFILIVNSYMDEM